MKTYITVLNSDMNKNYWRAVQKSSSLDQIKSNKYYTAGISINILKHDGDEVIEPKRVTETFTWAEATANIILVNDTTTNYLNILSGKLSKKKIKELISLTKLAPIIIGFFLLNSCGLFTTHGHLTKRYSHFMVKDNQDISKLIDVNAYILEKSPSKSSPPKTVFDLTEEAQKELITQLGKNSKDNSTLLKDLSSPLSKIASQTTEILDYTSNEKTLVVSIRNTSPYPADRIAKLTVNFDVGKDFKILSCNRIATEYQNIDYGKLNFSNALSAELSANLTGGGKMGRNTTHSTGNTVESENGTTSITDSNTGSSESTYGNGASEKLAASRNFSEEVLLKQRFVTLNASINNNILSLYQESTIGIDLSGNIITDFSFASPKEVKAERTYQISNLYTNEMGNSPENIVIKDILVKHFNYTNDLTADLTFQADIRKVIKNDQTESESDDVVELLRGNSNTKPKKVILISKNKLNPKFWIITDDPKNNIPIRIYNPTINGMGDLVFNNYKNAQEFLAWLNSQKVSLIQNKGKLSKSNYNLYNSSDKNLTENDFANLQIILME